MKFFQQTITVCIGLLACLFANSTETNLKPGNIRVLLEKDVSEALLEIRGPYYIFNPFDGTKISSGILGKRFVIKSSSAGIKWGQEYPGTSQLVIVPRTTEGSFILNGIQYEGVLAVYKINDKINLVNEIDIESYLKSVLASQFQYPLEPEAMAAVAITARTTAYFETTKNKETFWHVEASSLGYQGNALIIPDSVTTHAVEATKYLVLLNSKTEGSVPFMATWTEHCGGKTAPYHSIFRKDFNAPQDGVESSIAALDRKDSRWSYSISIDNLASYLNLKKITAIDVYQDTNSNKVYALRVKDEDKSNDVDFFTLQKIIGKKFLKSNDFTVCLRDNEIHFVGYGKGHGVGLCLYSASSMAQNGEIAIKILSKFFPNTFISNLAAKYPIEKNFK